MTCKDETSMRTGRLCLTALLVASTLLSCSRSSDLQWHEETGYRWADNSRGFLADYYEKTGFERLLPEETGIDFSNTVPEEMIAGNQNLLNGSGVATGDVDGDGLADIYFARLNGPNKLYRNIGGMRFEDITDRAGVAHEGSLSTGAVLADVDGNGFPDLLVTALDGGNALYLNDGTGKFTLNADSGLEPGNGSTTAAFADIDKDGDLDLYITRYKEKFARDLFGLAALAFENTVEQTGDAYQLKPPFDEHLVLFPAGQGELPGTGELGTEDQLYLNNGDGSFQRATDLMERFMDADDEPLGLAKDWGLTAKYQDLNGDGWPDLYVCNDYWTPDRIWINRGDGTFRALGAESIRNMSFSSMAVDFSDINKDGVTDLFVTEMLDMRRQRRARQVSANMDPYTERLSQSDYQPQYMRNSLYLGRSDGTYAEISYFSGVAATGWSWATRFLDVDLDGYEDLIVNTGYTYDVLDLDTQMGISQRSDGRGSILDFPPLLLPNVILRNNGDMTFSEISADWGFTGDDVSHGLATADFDNDGDLDLVINRFNEVATVYENRATAARIAVRLRGSTPNTGAIGARVQLAGGSTEQVKELVAGGDYLSGSDPILVFASDLDHDDYELTITWADGSRTNIDGVVPNRIYEIDYTGVGDSSFAINGFTSASDASRSALSGLDNSSSRRDVRSPEFEVPLFEDISDRVSHIHHDDQFQSEPYQPLAPMRKSKSGPGVAWIDITGDGRDDLLVGSGKGAGIALFENLPGNRFEHRMSGRLTRPLPGDQTALIGWRVNDSVQLITGISNFERQGPDAASVYHYTFDGSGNVVSMDSLPGFESTTGPIAASDVNGDGAIDLFVGGAFIPGRYPADASSRLFLNQNGQYVPDTAAPRLFEGLGLVNGALFTDYDGDGDPDLLVSTEWGSLKLFVNNLGQLTEVTNMAGLDRHHGWWNGIATGDFNNDGRPDIVATNMGLNSHYQLMSEEPLRIYYDDFDGDSRLEILEAEYEPGLDAYVPIRDFNTLYEAVPAVVRNVRSFEQFSTSSLEILAGLTLNRIPYKQINELRHMVFLNEGDHFSAYPLPVEAQLTTAFSVGTADFNNDGNEDLFLSQNLFSLPESTPRQDAGRGLVLLGDGQGGFRALAGDESGVKVYGEQRGTAFSDFDGDGRTDLAVSQNRGPVQLYLNQTPESGIRVRLDGPPGNEDGIGSSLRLVYPDDSKGPRREIQAGTGYWSQNSTAQVLGKKTFPAGIEVTWFDGRVDYVSYETRRQFYSIGY